MIRWAILALLTGGCSQLPERGGGIVSVNPCADAALVALVPPARIAAISHYSLDPAATSIPLAVARRFRTTAGTAEEVIALKPDLVVASSFTPPATEAAFARAGLRILKLGAPATIADSKAQIDQIAAAVGEPVRGRAINAAIASAVDRAEHSRAGRRRPAALLFIAGDLANGGGTLLDELMTRAGFRNAAASYGLQFTGRLPAETIATHPPDIVIAPPADDVGRGVMLRRRLLPHTPEAIFARDLINCGGPRIVPALARLSAIRADMP